MGVRVEPTYILKIVDPAGNVVKDYSKPEGRRVLDQRYAWIMADILKDMTDTSTNGSFVFAPFTSIGRPAGLKTGTTDDQKDVLAIGWVPKRLTAVWMGNSNNTEMRGISSALGPGILWRDYMKTVVGGLPADDWYPRPEGIVDKVVCVNPAHRGGNGSGLLPGPNCPFRMTEHFVQGTEPKTDDRNFYTSCGINLRAPFSDWQADYNRWASGAVSGAYSYSGRFSWRICGFAPKPSESPSASPSGPPGAQNTPNPANTPKPTNTPRPSRRP
jgi:membrane peptidoglycan carboxypeptidase